MSSGERLFSAGTVLVCLLLVSAGAAAKAKAPPAAPSYDCVSSQCPVPPEEPGEGKDGGEGKGGDESGESKEPPKTYQRIYYSFALGGSYFTRRKDIEQRGNVGAQGGLDYRIAKFFSFGTFTYYGWQIGGGNQYWSTFNPIFTFYPMMYKNPNLEPYIMLGGHVLDTVYGDADLGKVGMAQGGFAGVGLKWEPEGGVLGFQGFVRASFLYMQRPSNAGGRSLTIPIYGFIGVVY